MNLEQFVQKNLVPIFYRLQPFCSNDPPPRNFLASCTPKTKPTWPPWGSENLLAACLQQIYQPTLPTDASLTIWFQAECALPRSQFTNVLKFPKEFFRNTDFCGLISTSMHLCVCTNYFRAHTPVHLSMIFCGAQFQGTVYFFSTCESSDFGIVYVPYLSMYPWAIFFHYSTFFRKTLWLIQHNFRLIPWLLQCTTNMGM